MRIFDPKDQLGNSLLSSADTQRSSVKLEKQMTVGGGAITLTSTDISDIENWELSNASVEVDGQMISFLPDTSRDGDGNLVITLGETFSDVVLVLKRTVFDGMKQEEEEITIEVKIQRLMAKTIADSKKPDYDASANIAQWKALGVEAYKTDPVKYEYAEKNSLGGYHISGTGEVVVDDYFLSADTLSDPEKGGIIVADTVTGIKWHSDLPCFSETSSENHLPWKTIEFTGKIPNVTNASGMFQSCIGLASWNVVLPNSLTDVSYMFAWTRLKSFTPSLAGLTNCENFEYMFQRCILDKESIENILETLPDRKNKDVLTIHVGGDIAMEQSVKNELSSLAQSVSSSKRWNIVLDWNIPWS